MLTDATVDQRIATGFHRNTLLNQEGGIDVEEARWETLVDRVNTTATVWLGSTLGCAQCHDHKFDPFTQKDYYRMLAFFDNGEYQRLRRGAARGGQVDRRARAGAAAPRSRSRARRRSRRRSRACRPGSTRNRPRWPRSRRMG